MSTTGARVRTHAERVAWALADIDKQLTDVATKTTFHEREVARWRDRAQVLMLRRFRLEREHEVRI
jgi:hypothetical protein